VLSFDGAYVGVSDDNGVVRVYDAATGSRITVPSTIGPPIWLTAPFVRPAAPTITAPTRPTITHVRQAHRTWRETTSRNKVAPVGTTFLLTLSEPANILFRFTQHTAGREVKGKCVARTRKNRRAHRCTRTAIRGVVSFRGHRGKNKLSFTGTTFSSKKLKPGTYTLTVTATNAAGQHSKPHSLSFTIVE
jgi:hypothetical protein